MIDDLEEATREQLARLNAAEHLPQIARALRDRPRCLSDRPFEVAPETFPEAWAEMAAVMQARGFAVPFCADIDRPNFLFLGVAICPAGDDQVHE